MAISYPLTFPSVGISNISMRLKHAVAVSESPFTYDQKTYDWGGARWEAEVTLKPLTHSEAREVEAFLLGLRGMTGTFLLGHPLHTATPSSAVSLADNAFKGYTSLNLTGGTITAGSYFQLDDRLHILLEAKSTGSDTVCEINPPLRGSVTSGTALDFTLPVGKWRLASNDIGWSTNASSLSNFTFAIVEAI